MVIAWDYNPLFPAVLGDNQSLRGYYLHRAHLECVVPSQMYIILRTSKPVSRLIKASCNPLLADVLLRWPLAPPTPSERPTAHQTVSDSFVCSLQEPDTRDFGGLRDCLMASPDPERPSVTTLQGRPLLEQRGPGEAFRSPSSLEEDPPKTSSAEKG